MATPTHIVSLMPLLFLSILHCTKVLATSKFAACTSAPPCHALLGYNLHDNLTVKEIAELFQIDIATVLQANFLDLPFPSLHDALLPAGQLIKIPQSCACFRGTRSGISTVYVVKSGDTLSGIAKYYGNLITYQQIAAVNNISNPDLIFPDQHFVIPFPCACHDTSQKPNPAFFLSYQVQPGDSLAAIANNYNTTVDDLGSINSISKSSSLLVGDILYVPIAGSFAHSQLADVHDIMSSERVKE